jgi:drug/metabolite transporter superfamily protein YnfA
MVELEEQVLRVGRRGVRLRPFCLKAQAKPNGYSGPLERALSDFGAEESFGRAAARVKEHYGIEVGGSAIRRITYQHARKIQAVEPAQPRRPARTLITQIDGSMIPLVKSGPHGDRRKGKTLLWNEARLCCARAEDQSSRVYGATLGTLEVVSLLWQQTAQRGGLNEKTFVHGIGDGAPWIVEKFKDNFGAQGKYLIDFYHVSEYLAAAALKIGGAHKAARWLRKQKSRLMTGQAGKILRTLEPHREAGGASETPVEDASRYIRQRLQHLHYAQARKANLPIGSGEVESGHRHVIQHRLKLAGAWWKESNAQVMLGLRVARANNCWNSYWSSN